MGDSGLTMEKSVKSRGKGRESYRDFPSAKKTRVERFPFPSLGKKSKISLLSLGGKKSRIIENFPREEKGPP